MRHVKLNGIWYRLAEDAEGGHYALSSEPLRPPNSTVVQGDTSDTFQLRPDLLLWTWTDWSGGEGQLKFNPAEPGRSYILQGVDPFSRPGNLLLGYAESLAQIEGGGDFTWDDLFLGKGLNAIWLATRNQATDFEWEWDDTNEYFETGVAMGALGSGMDWDTLVGDGEYRFTCDISHRVFYNTTDDGANWTILNDQFDNNAFSLREKGDYVYVIQVTDGQVYELSKHVPNTATPEVPVYEFPKGGANSYYGDVACAGDTKVYFFTHDRQDTIIHEITPTNAAGTGYGRELSNLPGLVGEALWWSGGVLYLLARDTWRESTTGKIGPNRFIMYIDTEGAYGTLGSVRSLTREAGSGIGRSTYSLGRATWGTSSRLARSAFLIPATYEDATDDDDVMALFEIDNVTGGFAAVGRFPTDITTYPDIRGFQYAGGKYFTYDDNDDSCIIWDTSKYSLQEGIAISPIFDFGVAEEKILESLALVCEPLPTDASSISVGYSLDGGTWVDVELASSEGDIGSTLQISQANNTLTFRSMAVRVKLNTGTTATTPEVKAINVAARVNRHIRTWDLLLDASDDAAPQGYNGAQIVDNILSIEDNEVIPFVDRYRNHNHNDAGDTYDVIVDSSQYVLSQKGEGLIAVRLIELGESEGTLPVHVLPAGVPDDGTAEISPALPVNVSEGDAMIMVVEQAPGQPTPSTPTGWTYVGQYKSQVTGFADATKMEVWKKIYAPGDTDPVEIEDTGNHALGQIWAFSGIDVDDFPHQIDDGAESTNDTSITSFPSVTTTKARCLIVGILTQGDSALTTTDWSNSNLSNLTKVSEEDTAAGDDGSITLMTGELIAAGGSGTWSATVNEDEEEATLILALAPAPVT